jgi:chitinase
VTATSDQLGHIVVQWVAATDNTGVRGYTIRRNGLALTTVQSTGSATQQYTDTDVVPTTTYTYTIKAFDAAGNHSPLSNSATATSSNQDTTPPHATTYLTSTVVLANRIDLAWAAATDNVGVTRYTIQRDGTALATVAGNTTSYSDTTVAPATTYTYTIVAFDVAGNASSPSSPVTVTTPSVPDTSPPTAPTNLTGTIMGPEQVLLNWNAATDDTGVTSYIISRNGAELTAVSGDMLQYLDSTITPGTSYIYAVQAVDAANNHSQWSNIATVRSSPTITLSSQIFLPMVAH